MTIRPGEMSLAHGSSVYTCGAGRMALVLSVLLSLGSVDNVSAAVTVSGNVSPNPPLENSSVQIGSNGYGTFLIDNGTAFNSSSVDIGLNSVSFGKATVTDLGSVWTMNSARIGQSGVGQLEVRDGGVAIASSSVDIGTNSGHGQLLVTGADSLFQSNSQLTVGQSGTALLTIGAGAMVNVPSSQTRIGGGGRVQLEGGMLRTSSLENGGVISGTGTIEVECCGNQTNGRIQVDLGDHLLYRSLSGEGTRNLGEYLIYGGELEIPSRLQNDFQGLQRGLIELSQGTLRVDFSYNPSSQPQFENRGLLAAIGGENHLYGTVRNDFNGDIAITNNSLLMFHHDVVGYSSSTISVSAGSTAIFLQDLTLSGGTLLADLTGATGFGHVEVIGNFQFSGNLVVNLAGDYQPELGDAFPIAKVSGAITGTPNLEQLPNLAANLAWDVTTDNHELVLSVIAAPPVPGDFDSDGDVDGRDFLAWQRDPNVGNLADWQDNFSSPEEVLNVAAVPEPGSFVLLAACFSMICVIKQNRRHIVSVSRPAGKTGR